MVDKLKLLLANLVTQWLFRVFGVVFGFLGVTQPSVSNWVLALIGLVIASLGEWLQHQNLLITPPPSNQS